MSYSYSRITPQDMEFKTYGFQRCSSREVYSIVRRLRSTTYNTELYNGERFKEIPCPPRAPSAVCKKAKTADIEGRPPRPKPVFTSEKDLEKAFRRVRAQTISRMALEGKISPTYDNILIPQYGGANLDQSPHDQTKMMRRIMRPTTATRNRTWFSTLEEDNAYLENDIYDYEYVSARGIQDIVDRVSTPTMASEGGIGPKCPKRKDSIGKGATLNEVPLVSGLPRSRNVDEIVNRLYTPTESISICRRPVSAENRPRSNRNRHSGSGKSRPKSASAALAPPYFLRSLSSFSTESLSSSKQTSSRSNGSNRSKFSNASDYGTNSNKNAIVIKRKLPVGLIHSERTNKKYESSDSSKSYEESKVISSDESSQEKNKCSDLSDTDTSYRSDNEKGGFGIKHPESCTDDHDDSAQSDSTVKGGNENNTKINYEEKTKNEMTAKLPDKRQEDKNKIGAAIENEPDIIDESDDDDESDTSIESITQADIDNNNDAEEHNGGFQREKEENKNSSSDESETSDKGNSPKLKSVFHREDDGNREVFVKETEDTDDESNAKTEGDRKDCSGESDHDSDISHKIGGAMDIVPPSLSGSSDSDSLSSKSSSCDSLHRLH